MYVCHAFGMQLILVKIVTLSGKDRSGFRNLCHVALKNMAQKDGRTWRLGGCTFVLEQQPGS